MIEDYLAKELGDGRSANSDTIYLCPYCGKDKMYVVTDPSSELFGVFHCFHCGEKGSFTRLVAKLQDVTFNEAKELLSSIDNQLVSASNIVVDDADLGESLLVVLLKREEQAITPVVKNEDLRTMVVPKKKAPPLPVGLKLLSNNLNNSEAKPFINYLQGRGIGLDKIAKYSIGYINLGYAKTKESVLVMNNQVVFFSFDKTGKYNYWNTRAIKPTPIKSINAPELEGYYGKGDIVYNLPVARQQDSIILVEGVPDAMTLGDRAIATYGKGVTKLQKAQIVQALRPEQNLYIMLDMDASNDLAMLATEFYKYHKNTYIVYNPTNEDANALGTAKAYKIISNNAIKANSRGVMQFELLAKLK